MPGEPKASAEAVAAKGALRRVFLEARWALGQRGPVLGLTAQETLCDHEAFRRARTVMVYLAFRGEVPTDLIVRRAAEDGKVVCAPVTLPAERRLVPVRLTGLAGELRPGAYGILEPDPARYPAVPPDRVDLVVVPGVAFDLRGARLGYGGGYYDRFLASEARRAVRAGLAFEVQISATPLPAAPHDCLMDLVFTERRIIVGVRREGTR
ncbi:MAG: 5-formyltetrahydrofolate cyclo-ligase [Firmicutes bacterium]|nr:5-formyltetrahydrofolate cyclo-ligase [Bacillota bacterium]